jgi:hypothetical protein
VKTQEELIQWAAQLGAQIQEALMLQRSSYGDYWTLKPGQNRIQVRASVASALSFLREYAGKDSEWYERAKAAGVNEADGLFDGAYQVGALLRVWVANLEDGMTSLRIPEGTSARSVASTDVMEQVRELLRDRNVHPAAPIVLAGAALETALRGAVEDEGLTVDGKPGISAYGKALRSAELISRQDMKDIEQMGGLRNDAAHGHFGDLSPERASLMEQQVNMFLARLGSLMGD